MNPDKLDTFGIYELRNFARTLGIPRPTTLLRKDLLEQINKRLNSDVKFPPPSLRGRPPRTRDYGISQILNSETRYEDALDTPAEIQHNTFSIASAYPSTGQTIKGSGYVHIVPRGHGVFISSCLNTYHIPINLVTANHLETGDYLETKSIWNEQENRYIVKEILNTKHTCFDNAESVRPFKTKKVGGLQFKLGQRVIICTERSFDRIEQMALKHKEIADAYKIALLVEESDDCVTYLQENDIDEVYLIKVNFSAKKQIALALTSLFNAKRQAAQKKNVILLVDNLNKLFRLYNSSAVGRAGYDINHINQGPLADLKNFFMSSKQTKDKGSLTVMAYANEPSSEISKFIFEEFTDLANVYHKVTNNPASI